MIYKNANGSDDFKVEYTLVIPEEENRGYQLSVEERNFLEELDEAYAEIEQFTNQADKYDYALAVSSGIITGFIDAFFVGEWDFRKAKANANKEVNNKIINFAKKDPQYLSWCNGEGKKRWKQRDPNRLLSAVEFLEEKYKLPGDNEWKFEGSGISALTHHLDDFCHHPTLIGMICCILVQFTGNAKYHSSTGESFLVPVTVNEYGNFVSENAYGKVFSGIVNWFFCASKTIKNQEGHLMSDMAGSKTSVKAGNAGAGVPGTVMSTMKELSALPCFKDTNFAENLRKAYQNGIGNTGKKLDLGIFNYLFEGANNKVDMRTELAVKHELQRQAVPIGINEVVVRAFYFVRRFIEQINNKKLIMEVEWKKLLPVNNRTIARMLTVSTGTFVVIDQCDAVANGAKEAIKTAKVAPEGSACLAAFMKGYILKVNFVGIGRFTIAVGTDFYMGVRKNRLELAVASGEIAKTSIEVKQTVAEVADNHVRVNNKLEALRTGGEDDDTLYYEEDCSFMVEFAINDITIEELTEAANRIFSSTEKDFANIKSEKWYQTIFYNLPFSQNGQKYVVKDIKSLAKLQQIFLEIITKIDRETQQQFLGVINEIIAQKNTIAQTQKEIKQIKGWYEVLRNRIRGVEEQQSIDTLDAHDAQVLVLLLLEFRSDKNVIPDEVKKYNRGIMKALRRETPMGKLCSDLIVELNSPKVIYRCFLEQCAVAGTIYNKEWLDNVEIAKYFDIGIVQKEKIEKSVKIELEAFGIEYFYDKYEQSKGLISDSGFVIVPSEQEKYLTIENQETVTESISNDSRKFDEAALANLQAIIEKHGVVKDDLGYRELTNKFFDILPDAYLGKKSLFAIYFTVAGLYIRLEDDEWIEMKYEELCPEKIIRDNSEEKDKISLTVKDVKGKSFIYTADEKSCNEFTDLIFALKDAKISGDDKYHPIFCRETYFYGEILIDFLKLADHNSVAALKKCSEIMVGEEADQDNAFKEIFEYAFLDYKVTKESLKRKILEWKKTINPCAVNLYMAILVKDLVEVLQLASGEPSAMTSVEKYFLDWLMGEAGIEDTNKFLEMIRLPYCLISKGGKRYIEYSAISEVEKYAYKEQMHIPYHILDNEKLGLWSSLYKITMENDDPLGFRPKKIETFLNLAEWTVYFEFCASMYTFLVKVYSLEGILFTSNDINNFLMQCGFTEYFEEIVEEELYNFLEDDNWINVWQKFYDDDRRTLGMEMVNEFFLDKNYRKKKATIRASKRYNNRFQESQKRVNMLKENDLADNYNVYGKTSEEYQDAVNNLIGIYESEINDLDRKKERTYTQSEYKKLIVNSHAELSLERFAFDEEGDICFMIGDITWLKVDCIVNATYSLLGEGGIAKEIHMAAGPELLEECIKLKKCTVGETKITKGYKLNAKYIIHTIIPKYTDKNQYIEELRNCYKNTLELAKKNNIHTIAFPTLSTEFKGHQVNEICETVLRVISSWQNDNPEYPLFVVICNHSEETYNAYKRAEEKIDKEFLKKLGFHNIQKCFEIVKDGEPGVLVWDYFLYNEISFLSSNTLKSESLFKSMSDSKTEKEFERLSRKYGISNES